MAVRNFYWLFEGSLAGGARPGADASGGASRSTIWGASDTLDDDLAWLKSQGIGAVLTLTETPLPVEALDRNELASLHIPIVDQTAPTQAELLAALDFIDQQQVAGRAVLVHCKVGEGRTGTILAAYLIHHGATSEEAIARIRWFRPGAISAPSQQDALTVFARLREWIV